MHLLGAATVWHDKPIRLHTHHPTTTHLRVYVAERGAHHSSAQTPTQGREVVPSCPLVIPNLRRGPHLLSRWPLGTWDSQLRQLMEDLWQEAAHRELTTSPIGPPLGCWRTPASGRDTNLKDEEVTLQGGGDGDPESHHCSPHALFIQRRMLATSAAHLQPD